MADAPLGRQSHSSGYVWYVVGLLSVVNLINFMDRVAFTVLMPAIKAEFNLTDSQLGLLAGFAFSLFYAVCGIPIARWADRGIRRDIIALALAVWSVMTALTGAAQNFLQLLVARFGVGAGEAGAWPSAFSMICDYIPFHRRSGVIAIHNLGPIAGGVIGMTLAGTLAETVGWRWTFVIFGIPGLLLALIVRLTLREPVRGAFDAVEPGAIRLSLWATLGILWRCRSYRLLLIFMSTSGFVNSGVNLWWPSFYTRVFEMPLTVVGAYLGLATGLGGALGMLSGGFLANKVAERGVGRPLAMGALSICVMLPLLFASLVVSSAYLSLILAGLAMFFFTVQGGPVLAALYSVIHPSMRATGGTISTFFLSLIGFGLGPFAVGLLSDILTPSYGVEGLRYALLATLCLVPLTIYLLWAAARQLPNDLGETSFEAVPSH